MTLDLFREKGVPLERQTFDWRELAPLPYSKLDDDAFTRVRVILMNGIEAEAVRFQHACARMNAKLQPELANIRRIEHHQQTLVNWLHPPDQSPLETTIGFEQTAIEVTAAVAVAEPDPYLGQVYRFGLLEDFDHLYRYSALYDRLEGKDPNVLLQSYTDILSGRPTAVEHRAPIDDLRAPYERTATSMISKLHALTIMGGENQTHDYYMTIGPMFSDPLARQLYAEIASIEEQHVTQYESIIDTSETWLEKWLLHEAAEVYNYWSCAEAETNARIKAVWERFTAYELGHFHAVKEIFQRVENRDAAEVIDAVLPEPIRYESHRELIRQVLRDEVSLRATGNVFVPEDQVPEDNPSQVYRRRMNEKGSPSEIIATGYVWTPGGELVRSRPRAQNVGRA
jgi:rubrerythrin